MDENEELRTRKKKVKVVEEQRTRMRVEWQACGRWGDIEVGLIEQVWRSTEGEVKVEMGRG